MLRLLRAARRLDATPALKALLPASGTPGYLSFDHPLAPPLEKLVVAHCRGGGASPAHADALAALFEANDTRRERSASKRPGEIELITRPPEHSVTPFLARLDASTHRWRSTLAALQLAEDPVDIITDMQAAGFVPPRAAVLTAIRGTASSHDWGGFERSLALFWHLDLRTPWVPCAAIADALVDGALQLRLGDGGDHEPQAPWRALSIAEALLDSGGLRVSARVANALLHRCLWAALALAEAEAKAAAGGSGGGGGGGAAGAAARRCVAAARLFGPQAGGRDGAAWGEPVKSLLGKVEAIGGRVGSGGEAQ